MFPSSVDVRSILATPGAEDRRSPWAAEAIFGGRWALESADMLEAPLVWPLPLGSRSARGTAATRRVCCRQSAVAGMGLG
jgi:hypothetical protein